MVEWPLNRRRVCHQVMGDLEYRRYLGGNWHGRNCLGNCLARMPRSRLRGPRAFDMTMEITSSLCLVHPSLRNSEPASELSSALLTLRHRDERNDRPWEWSGSLSLFPPSSRYHSTPRQEGKD